VLFVAREFAVFFVIVLPIAWLLRPHPTAWKMFMLASSLFFYGWWHHDRDDWTLLGSWLPRYVVYLLVFAAVNHALAQLAGRMRHRGANTKPVVLAACLFDLGGLFYFKYFEWARGVSNDWLHTDLRPTNIILPIAVSFIAFQALGYVIDVHRGTIEPIDSLDFFTYLFFFPHLAAGPLVRVGEFEPQLRHRADPRSVDASRAFLLIASGFVKKVIVSWLISDWIVKDVFANPTAYSGLDNLFATYGFAVQIYCDFSGYTDIAIGLALLLGIRFPQNFDRPYRSLSMQEFWRRWHMTLSRWLRDYLYISLGGNRNGELRTYMNLFLTMFIGGIWHGADWTFVVWGTIHGLALAGERFFTGKVPSMGPAGPFLRWLATFNVVCLGWIFFEAGLTGGGMRVAFDVLGQIFSPSAWGQGTQLVTFGVVALIAIVLAVQFVPEGYGRQLVRRFSEWPAALQAASLGIVMVVCYRIGSVDDFIYFQF
jgi:D-alanyl-lipoteichoic acid acyltransferase DltB (MBOAT superfamily)